MLEALWQFIVTYHFNTALAFYTYWIPLAVCAIGYLADCSRDFKVDKENYTKDFYDPKLTVGLIIGRGIVSIIPGVNICVAIFWHGWHMVFNIIDFFSNVLHIPILPHRPKAKVKDTA